MKNENYIIWERIKKAIDSCISQQQLNVCRNLLGHAINNEYIKGEDYMEYHNDLSRRIRLKRLQIQRNK